MLVNAKKRLYILVFELLKSLKLVLFFHTTVDYDQLIN